MAFDEVEHDRAKAAHHEGGHLAVGWALGATLLGGDIVPDGIYGGAALYTLDGEHGASPDRVISILAGPTAQSRFARGEPDGGQRDRERAAAQIEAMCRHPAAASILHRHCQAEADRLVAANWDAIEAIADALRARGVLTGDELAEVLADVETTRANAAEPGRRRRWADIEARGHRLPKTFTRTRQ